MSFTNINLVRKHFVLDDLPAGFKSDYPVIFPETEWIDLPGRGIIEDSVVVKASRRYSPVFELVSLGETTASLANNNLVANSVVVASDDSLGTIYRENIDFSVAARAGTINRLPDGEIETGATVAVWYYYFSVYRRGVDYAVDADLGRLRRMPGGDIQPAQSALVDYSLSSAWQSENLLSQAVAEANAIMEKQVDTRRSFGADRTLQTAATCLAVSIVCRMMAINDLRSGPSSRAAAASWMTLADSYRHDFETLLKLFRPDAARMKYPTLS